MQQDRRRVNKLNMHISGLQFDKVQYPASAPVEGWGAYSLVLGREDGEVSKVLFDHDGDKTAARNFFNSEVLIHNRLGGMQIDTARIPTLNRASLFLNTRYTIGEMRIEKCKGRHVDWLKDAKNLGGQHFQNIGRILANFNEQAGARLSGLELDRTFRNYIYGEEIERVSHLPETVNQVLERCNTYLQSNMRSGACHGDFSLSNFLVNGKSEICAIFDLSHAGIYKNHLLDFVHIPDESLSEVVSAYELEAEEDVDRDMVVLTKVSMYAALLNYFEGKEDEGLLSHIGEYEQLLAKTLNALPQDITGRSTDLIIGKRIINSRIMDRPYLS